MMHKTYLIGRKVLIMESQTIKLIVQWAEKFFSVNTIILGVFLVGTIVTLVFVSYLINDFIKIDGKIRDVFSGVVWVFLLMAGMLFLQKSFEIIAHSENHNWNYSNLQLIVLFYCLYSIKNKGIVIFNYFCPLIVSLYYLFNAELRYSLLLCVSLIILSIDITVINRFKAYLIDTNVLYLLTQTMFGVGWWGILECFYHFKFMMFFLLIFEFKLAMNAVHMVNKLVRKVVNKYSLLENEVEFDELTGAHSRNAFDKMKNEVFEMYHNGQVPLTFLMFDIDHFKQFNDTYGHMAGDQVLHDTAQLFMKELFRLRTGGELFRVGGEEFIVIFRGQTAKQTVQIIEHIQKSLVAKELTLQGDKVHINISCGITSVRKYDLDVSRVYKRVDNYLYRSKNEGRNRLTIEGNTVKFG